MDAIDPDWGSGSGGGNGGGGSGCREYLIAFIVVIAIFAAIGIYGYYFD